MGLASIQASLLGTRLQLFLGPTIAVPAPALIVEALSEVEVSLSDEGRDGFQLTFTVGRTGVLALDYALLANPLLRPFTRVVIQMWLGVMPQVLIDGFITKTQLTPNEDPGASTFTVTGEDVRVLMDLHEVSMPYPAMPAEARVALILARYAVYLGLPPLIIPSPNVDVPLPTRQIPVQADTDLGYLDSLAAERDYVFYVEPTPAPMVNLAYWGPPPRLSLPQSALSINVGPESNATLRFDYNGLTPTIVLGAIQDKDTQAIVPVVTVISTRPPLAPLPAMVVQQPYVRSVMAKDAGSLDPLQAFARAQALTDRSSDVITADGELDMQRYGDILRPRRLVGVRGAGWSFDGFYYVKRVTHRIKRGEYKQSFSLTREGVGALSPVVPT